MAPTPPTEESELTMPSVIDPQNPVHFAPNASIPTVLDRTKPAYGLAQGIADGPSTQRVGGVVTRSATGVQVSGPVSTPNGAVNLGGFQFVPEAGARPEVPA